MAQRTIAQDFDANYVVDPVTGCWLWQRAIGSHGYGVVWSDGVLHLAHRFSVERSGRLIPEGLLCCHKCDVRRCVNPEHVFFGTDKDNHQDALRKGRGRRGIHRGEANATAKLTEVDVRRIRLLVAAGALQTEVAKEYNLHKTNVSCICRRVTWAHLL